MKKGYCTMTMLLFLMWTLYLIFPEDSIKTKKEDWIRPSIKMRTFKVCMDLESKLELFLAKHGKGVSFQTILYSKDTPRGEKLQHLEELCGLLYNTNHTTTFTNTKMYFCGSVLILQWHLGCSFTLESTRIKTGQTNKATSVLVWTAIFYISELT